MTLFAQRRDRLRTVLAEEKIPALLVTQPIHVRYLTGFTGDSSYLLLSRDRTVFISDERFRIQIAEECPDLETAVRSHNKSTAQEAVETITKLGISTIGFESRHVTVAQLDQLAELNPAITWQPTGHLVEGLRRIKDASEIAAVRASIDTAESAFRAFRAGLCLDATEKELSDELENLLRKRGGVGVSFPTIAAVGERAALPHCPPSNKRLRDGSFLLLDWGNLDPSGYVSDITRLIRVPGAEVPSERRATIERIYAVVLEAQRRAIAAMGPGVPVRIVDEAARKYIDEQGFGANFNHGLGHGIGLMVHEAPDIRSISTDVLAVGMVVTCEPGIYLPGIGGVRIEDDIHITESGAEILTTLPRDWSAVWGN